MKCHTKPSRREDRALRAAVLHAADAHAVGPSRSRVRVVGVLLVFKYWLVAVCASVPTAEAAIVAT